VSALATGGCQDSETGRSTAAEIGPAGGEVHVAGATLLIPKDALAYRLRVELAKLESNSVVAPAATQLAGPAFALRPHGTRFDTLATLTLPYSAGPDDYVFAARLDNEQDRTWEFVPGNGSFDDEREASFDIDGFSVYVMVKTKVRDFGGGSGGSGGAAGGTGGAGNEGGEGGREEYSYERFCELACAAQAELDCNLDRSEVVCRNNCIDSPPDENDGCFNESDAYRRCVWEVIPRAFECGNDGKSGVKTEICEDEVAELVDCEGL
jgi:hypothetical protein